MPPTTPNLPTRVRARSPRLLSAAATCGALLTALGSNTAQAAQVHQDLSISRMDYRYVYVPAGATYTWETTNLAGGADTVLHLWDWGTASEVGYDDDGGVGLASQVSYTNYGGSTKSLVLVMRSYSSYSAGTARLLQNGIMLQDNIPVGGKRITVENGVGYEHETVMPPDGATWPYMLALDSSFHMVDLDYVSGVGSQARVAHPDTYFVVVGTTGGSGNVHLYTNDATDLDGDGVGNGLEWELGTCDFAGWAHCTDVHNLADTDRDGIPDAAEIFGIEDYSNPQHLPAWGADPLHKDVFVELDYNDVFTDQPFTESDAVYAQQIFDDGLADDLVNPDGQDGVRLHIDMGVEPADPSLATLFGDWGGSNSVPDGTSYKTAPETYRDPVREGIFRYALVNEGYGGGQAEAVPADRFNWKAKSYYRYVGSFAHELGHAVGLEHHGHDTWGEANGKANYLSLMNYAYPDDNFSQGQSAVTLNPALVDEQAGIGADASHVANAPYVRQVSPADEIDWDFDSLYSGGGWSSLRAPITYATGGTSAFSQNEQTLHNEADLPGTTPALIRGPGERLYAFYVDDSRIYYRHALVDGNSWEGSCPGGDEIGDSCTTWSAAVEVPTAANARGLTAIWADGQVLLAFRTHWDSLRTIRATGADGAGTLTGWTGEHYHGVHTDKEPEVEFMRVDPGQFAGENLVAALLYRDKYTGQYRWRTMANVGSASSTDRGALLTDSGSTLYGTESPTFTSWPYDPMTAVDGTTCGAITDTAGEVGFYCYDRGTNRFEDLTAGAFSDGVMPQTTGKPGLAFHAYRSWAGLPRAGEDERGAFWLTVTVAASKWDYVRVWISDPVSEYPGEALADTYFPEEREGYFGNEWSNMVDGAGLALYDDPELGAMKGLWLRQDKSDETVPLGDVKLRFLPFADGGFRASLQDGNDFQVMERGICLGLADAGYCGPSSFGLD